MNDEDLSRGEELVLAFATGFLLMAFVRMPIAARAAV